MTTKFDPADFKKLQKKDWNEKVSVWEKWWHIIDKAGVNVTKKLLAKTGIKTGKIVLDLATGTGEPALSAARLVGDKGKVIAVDQAGDMLKVARKRGENLSNLEFIEEDIEIFDIGQHHFDVVLSRWGLMFCPDVEAMLKKIHNGLKPGGKLALSVWSSPDKVPSISLSTSIVMKALGVELPEPDMPGVFSLSNQENLKTLLEKAGFNRIELELFQVPFTTGSMQEYIGMSKDFLLKDLQDKMSQKSDSKQNDIWESIKIAAKQYETEDGKMCMHSETIIASAVK